MRETERVNQVFLLTVICYLAVSIVIGIISADNGISFVPLMLLSQAGLALVPVCYAVKRGHVFKQVGLKGLSFGTIILVFFFMICLEPFLTFINALSQCFVDTPTTSMIIEEAANRDFVTMFLLVAVVPAILEEFVYRGVFFRTYAKQAVIPGAFFSGLLFGVMHGNWNQFVYAFFMGVFFSLTVYATGSLLASMLMHLTVNGLSIILVYAFPELAAASGETAGVTFTVEDVVKSYLAVAVFGLLLAFFLFRAIAQRCGTWEKLRQEFHRKGKLKAFFSMFTIPLAIGVLIMFALMTATEFL